MFTADRLGVSLGASKFAVLIVEDDPHSLQVTADFVAETGARVRTATTVSAALEELQPNADTIGCVVTDIKLGADSGLALFQRIREVRPDLPVVLITGYGSTGEAVAAMRDGALYYFVKPVDFPLLTRLVREALEKRSLMAELTDLRARLPAGVGTRILGSSQPLQHAMAQAAAVAGLDTTVLLIGETGTGKELFAEYIHACSPRRDRRLVAINCAALPEPLLESELFGHERGAFTGAVSRTVGKFQCGHGGTVFLDEVGDLARPLQAKLLRVLETKQVQPLGSTATIAVDVRIVAATNQDLSALVRQGVFREDLYYRLDAFPIVLPPLRDRRDDIPLLAAHFLRECARDHGKAIQGFEAAVFEILQCYDWPGNVRELGHCVERAVILADGPLIRPAHLPARLFGGASAPVPESRPVSPLTVLREIEHDVIRRAVETAGGNRSRAARELGITRNQIRYRLHKMQGA